MKDWLRSTAVGALTLEARLALLVHRPKIVAVTGNVGKTTTKDAIFAVVSGHSRARKSQKSFNSDIGVPLAILGLENPWSNPLKWAWTLLKGVVAALAPGYPKLLVLEVGADTPGDISSIARWLRPDIVVFTGMPEIPVHIERFSSREEMVREKRSLLEQVRPGGTAIVNGDFNVAEATQNVAAKLLTYGTNLSCDISASDIRIATGVSGSPAGMVAKIHSGEETFELIVNGALGKPVISAALAALTVARTMEIDRESAARSLAAWQPPAGRMRVLRGKSGATILDDSYNSSPAAAISALETLQTISAKRKIVVLGDMRELGAKSAAAHEKVGALAARVADMLVTVGEESKVLARAAREAGMQDIREYGYDSSVQVGNDLARELRSGDVVLVKGSQNRIRLERCVHALLADPSEAEKVLVRFDKNWRWKV